MLDKLRAREHEIYRRLEKLGISDPNNFFIIWDYVEELEKENETRKAYEILKLQSELTDIYLEDLQPPKWWEEHDHRG